MSVSLSTAASAYGNAARLLQESSGGGGASTAKEAAGGDFASMVSESIQSVVDNGNKADQISMDMLNGKANVVDMVSAVAETELAVQTMVTVRDKVISAYEEIMRMQI